ncbi:NACHT domain-containing protein [Pseudomonas sp. MWU13-3659]|uniref:NACHT domain-containing protein n=1 Tax=Pseudomonas sp. MWU13-3659 TaxID=2986964 RepID=UPI002074F22E|nr:NACHT domain-containing protein [Pseudomonas sp. MWU13-3659]
MNGSQQFAIVALLVALVTVYLGVTTQSLMVGLLLACVSCAILLILRPLLMPAGYGVNKIRMASLLGVLALAGVWGGWSRVLDSVLQGLVSSTWIAKNTPFLASLKFSQEPSLSIVIFVAVVVIAINYFMREKTIDSVHPGTLDKDFPEEGFRKKLLSFCSVLDRHLVHLDLQSNWSPEYYTELKAEVEILSSYGKVKSKKVLNLQTAITMDRTSQAFLLLGVPGSGKSVALRKLAGDMLREAKTSGRIPIYVNLREWRAKDGGILPAEDVTVEGLTEFIIKSLTARGDRHCAGFVNDYFLKLWRHGRLFFIFDSFDEMPNLLDAGEDSEILAELSTVLSKFISSSPNSRGVLASRVFRSPSHYYQAQKVLEIRPLSEVSIAEALERFPHVSEALKAEIFSTRSDLVPLARNPFLMTLLGEWVSEKALLPKSQAEIYEFYLRRCLESCKERLEEASLSVDDVLEVARKIAYAVFTSPSLGLEAPVSALDKCLPNDHVETVVELLNYARIARVSDGPQRSFAFVHRRFLEYFVTLSLLENACDVPVDHIPTDSRGRDALVLYAQHCSDAEAQRLAELCWSEVETHFDNPKARMRAIHCLRFIVEAFCSRKTALVSVTASLEKFIAQHTVIDGEIILAKICLEGTGLISEKESVPVLTKAIQVADVWLQETAFRACRVLPRLASPLEDSIVKYVKKIPLIDFLASYRGLSRSLLLSDSMKHVHGVVRLRWLNCWLALLGGGLIAVASPQIIVNCLLISAVSGAIYFYTMQDGRINQTYGGSSLAALFDSSIKIFRIYLFMFGVASGLRIFGSPAQAVPSAQPLAVLDGLGGVASVEVALTLFFLDVRQLFPDFWGLPGTQHWLAPLIVLFAAVMVLDWLSVADGIRFGLKMLKPKNWDYSFLVFMLLLSCAGLLMVWVVVENDLGLWFGYSLAALAGFVLLAGLTAKMIWLFEFAKDYRYIKAHVIRAPLSRSTICQALNALRTQRGKLKYIRNLDAARAEPSGDWPEGFKLRVGGGAALSQLARLEARWLRLER